MHDFSFLLLLLFLLALLLVIFFARILNNTRLLLRKAEAEREEERTNLEIIVRERTRNLEMIRDSVSEYAVQKSELA